MNWSFEVRYRKARNKGGERRSPLVHNDSVLCDTQVEARRWMIKFCDDVVREGGRVIEAHTYRSEL